MARPNCTHIDPNGPTRPPKMGPQEALNQARLALSYLLWAEPPLETFETDRLEAALAKLSDLVATLEPAPLYRAEGGDHA